jgi:Ulp1 family protease
MASNSSVIPTYIKQLSMEATFQANADKDTYFYGYATYNQPNLKGSQINKMKQYNILAHSRIPITENEFLDMALNTDKNDKILDFHMTYVRNFSRKDILHLQGYSGSP